MKPCATPHIEASPSDFAPVVLMPGDPLRSRFIAENYLENARLVNDIRGVQGYTGRYRGTPVSVMASGMGIPSIGIYSYELYHVFGVETIIRVGSAGAVSDKVAVRDLVIGMGACTDSAFGEQYHLPGTFAPIASYEVLSACVEEAKKAKMTFHVGNLLSSDRFYSDDDGVPDAFRSVGVWGKMGVLAVEMEAAGLYMTAARAGKRALAVCTVSNHLLTGEELSAAQRQTSFTDMITLSLETARNLCD